MRKPTIVRAAVWTAGLALLVFVGLRVAAAVGWTGDAGGRVAGGQPAGGSFGGAALPVSVRAEPVRLGTVEEIAAIPGTLQPQYQVDVFARRAGRIASVAVEVGDRVLPGDIIAVVEHTDLLLQEQQSAAGLAAARASLRRAEAQLEKLESDHRRVALLYQQGAATEQELQNLTNQVNEARIQLEVAAAQLEQSEANYAMVQLQLSQVHVDVPVAGTVIQRPVVPGMQVSTTTPIATVAALDPIEVLFHVPERDFGRLAPGQPIVVFVDAFPGESFAGHVSQFAAAVDPQTRTVAVRGRVANPDLRLRPGMFARVEIALGRAEGVPLLPRNALLTGATGDYVFVVEQDRARIRRVTVGLQGREYLQVLSGLNVGDLIITVGQQAVREGQLLQVIVDAPPDPAPGDTAGGTTGGRTGGVEE